jgi:hypothetical protein
MSQQLHTEDLARTSSERPDGDDVVMAELAEPEAGAADRQRSQAQQSQSQSQETRTGQAATMPSSSQGESREQQGRATTGQPTADWPPQPDAKHWAGLQDHESLRNRWEAIQAGFVDEPRRAVEDADALVAQVIRQLAESFAAERTRLEAQWSRGDQVGTEDLRVALQRYRSFFQDLLSH